MDEKRPNNPNPANDPREPNPGDPGPAMPEPRTPVDPFDNESIPPQRPIPHGVARVARRTLSLAKSRWVTKGPKETTVPI